MGRIAISCVIAAICGIFADALQFLILLAYSNRSNLQDDFSLYKDLDVALIKEDWDVRMDFRALENIAGLFNAISWVILSIPIIQLTYALSMGGKHMLGLHVAIGALTIAGTTTEFFSHVMFVGAMTTMEWIADDFNLDYWINTIGSSQADGIGWRSLEVTFISIRGCLMWVNAMEWLFLGFILFLLFVSIRLSSGRISMAFGWYCLFLSIICFVDFSFEVLRFKSWLTFAKLSLGVTVLSRFLFWPIWYLFLGSHVARLCSQEPGQLTSSTNNDTNDNIIKGDGFGEAMAATNGEPTSTTTASLEIATEPEGEEKPELL